MVQNIKNVQVAKNCNTQTKQIATKENVNLYFDEIQQFVKDYYTPVDIAKKLQNLYFEIVQDFINKDIEVKTYDCELHTLRCLIQCFLETFTNGSKSKNYISELQVFIKIVGSFSLIADHLQELFFMMVRNTESTLIETLDDEFFVLEEFIKIFQGKHIC